MTDDFADERLRAAWQSLAATPERELSDSDLERVWRAVSGELSADERRALVERLAEEPALAEAWRLAHEIARPLSASQTAHVVLEPNVPRWTMARAAWTSPSWLAAAAMLLVGIALGVSLTWRPPPSEYRDVRGSSIETPLVSNAVLPRNAFVLRWSPPPGAARYHVTATSADLQVLADEEVTDPQLTVPADALSSLSPGARVLWRVDATLTSGERISSPTFVVRVQ